MRRLSLPFAVVAVVLVLTACDEGRGGPVLVSPLPPGSTLPSETSQPAPSVTPTLLPELPAGVPASYDEDVPGSDIPQEALIPAGSELSNRWMADTDAGEVIVVAYFLPGGDPFVQARGFVEWRRSEGAVPPWTPVFGLDRAKRDGVLGFDGVVGDVTSDGSHDLVLQEATGGSGACGTWRIIDLAAAVQLWTKMLCDARIDLSIDPVGLSITEAVYARDDPHCCPSDFRTTVLVYRDGRGFERDPSASG